MKISLLIALIFCSASFAYGKDNEDKFIFFLHNRFLEEHELDELHPEFGRSAFLEIINEFKKSGFNVISEKRNKNVNIRAYALRVKTQIDSLLNSGIEPRKITVVGTSKGGYIAQYVSTFVNNPKLNFVFIGSFRVSDMENLADINYCGNILNIYERTDSFGVSALERQKKSDCKIGHFKEIELNTGMGHGFLFKPLSAWLKPTIKWANGNYNL
ncbi:alpha/beta hydrolase [Gillisia hiemivivida]|uniref:Alpha/beta hydrolase n=1 Tax=Gillisia hiemivivida TaxID=291190 RepID=A0A5C6ZZ49_9FLAO|nr:alpha/beta hydrolase [Gillisia hiemivivida]TXD95340.1 alpha/beta hydrolase [Gillisia hiemivivida]